VSIILVTLQLRGPLKKYGPEAKMFDHEIAAESCTVRELLEQLKVPTSSISFIMIDGKKADLDATVIGGEMVIVNPRVSGG